MGAEWGREPVIRLQQALLVLPDVKATHNIGPSILVLVSYLLLVIYRLLVFLSVEIYSFLKNIRDSDGDKFLLVV